MSPEGIRTPRPGALKITAQHLHSGPATTLGFPDVGPQPSSLCLVVGRFAPWKKATADNPLTALISGLLKVLP